MREIRRSHSKNLCCKAHIFHNFTNFRPPFFSAIKRGNKTGFDISPGNRIFSNKIIKFTTAGKSQLFDVVGDAGIIDMPNGKRYLATIFVKRPYNNPIVRDFVRRISRIVYNYLDQPAAKVSENLR